jgi:LmbE family N-acetylglucosaminyl deacetylase
MSTRTRLRAAHIRVLALLARDISVRSTTAPTVVFAPHPDDETIGCGGVIARKRLADTPVDVVVAADGGDEVRRAECIEACRRLGVADGRVHFLGFPDGRLDEHRGELTAAMLEALRSGPTQIFVPAGIDAHPDHRALAAALADVPPHVVRGIEVLAYPIWFWNRWAWVERDTPRWRQRIQLLWRPVRHFLRTRVVSIDTSATVAQQRAALEAHRSQLSSAEESSGLDRDWLETFLRSRAVFFVARSR